MYKLLIFLFFFTLCLSVKSQAYKSSSHRVELGYLITNTGQGVQAGVSLVNKIENLHRASISYDFGDIGSATTSYKVIKLDYAHLYSLDLKDILNWNVKNNEMFLNAGGGGFVSCELLKNDLLDLSKNKFSPGISITLEFEIFYRKLGFFLTGNQLYRPLSIIGDWEYRFELGLKYML